MALSSRYRLHRLCSASICALRTARQSASRSRHRIKSAHKQAMRWAFTASTDKSDESILIHRCWESRHSGYVSKGMSRGCYPRGFPTDLDPSSRYRYLIGISLCSLFAKLMHVHASEALLHRQLCFAFAEPVMIHSQQCTNTTPSPKGSACPAPRRLPFARSCTLEY